MQKFRPKWLPEISVFGLKLAIFGSRRPIERKNGFEIAKNFFPRALGPFWCGPKFFRPPHPKKVDFGGAEISAKSRFGAYYQHFSTLRGHQSPKMVRLT